MFRFHKESRLFFEKPSNNFSKNVLHHGVSELTMAICKYLLIKNSIKKQTKRTELNTVSMRASSFKKDSHLYGQEIPCLFWNLKVHYHVNNNPPPEPILS
jgi:hypothetical protein